MQMRISLIEHIVINPKAVDAYAAWAAWTTDVVLPDELRQWLNKRVRQYIMNNSTILRRVSELSPTAPDYAVAAHRKGEPIYEFPPEGRADLTDRVQHLQHFFADLYRVISSPPQGENGIMNQVALEDYREAEKTMQKLPRMTFEQVEQVAEKWAARTAKRSSGVKKTGGDVVMAWPDGFYALRYTDLDTMTADGAVLQNCLSWGNYWDRVKSGREWIIGIRKANDEAVVSLRFIAGGPKIAECKGKNNKPVVRPYVPYVVALLNELHTTGVEEYTSDLEDIGVVYNDQTKQWGTFAETATLIVDKDGVKIFQAGSHFEVTIDGKYSIRGETRSDYIRDLDFEQSIPVEAILRGLNALPIKKVNSNDVHEYLLPVGIFQSGERWASIEDEGRNLGRFGHAEVISLLDGAGNGFLLCRGTDETSVSADQIGRIIVHNHAIARVSQGALAALYEGSSQQQGQQLALLANRLKLDASGIEWSYLLPSGWYVGEDGECKSITTDYAKVTPLPGSIQERTLYKVPNKGLWLISKHDGGDMVAMRLEKDGKCAISSTHHLGERTVAAAFQQIVSTTEVKRIANTHGELLTGFSFGLWFDSKRRRYVSKFSDVLRVIRQNQGFFEHDMGPDPVSARSVASQFMIFLDLAFLEDREQTLLPSKMVAELFDALKPSEPYRIKNLTPDTTSGLPIFNIYPANAIPYALKVLDLLTDKSVVSAERFTRSVDKAVSAKITHDIGKAIYRVVGAAGLDSFPLSTRAAGRSKQAALEMGNKLAKDSSDVDSYFQGLNMQKKFGK